MAVDLLQIFQDRFSSVSALEGLAFLSISSLDKTQKNALYYSNMIISRLAQYTRTFSKNSARHFPSEQLAILTTQYRHFRRLGRTKSRVRHSAHSFLHRSESYLGQIFDLHISQTTMGLFDSTDSNRFNISRFPNPRVVNFTLNRLALIL